MLATLRDKSFIKKLTSLVLPIAFQEFMFACVGASDTLMLGNLSQDSMSAISLANKVTFVYFLFLYGMITGFSVLAAQYWGKGDKRAIEKTMGIVVRVTFSISVVFALLCIFFPSYLMALFTNDEVLIKLGASYLLYISPTFILSSVSHVYLAAMKNSGRTFRCTIINMACVVINIVFNALLIYGVGVFPKLGIIGAALATTLARIVECVWALCESIPKDRLKFHFKAIFNPDKLLRKDFYKFSLPAIANQLLWGIGFTMGTVIIGHLNSDAVASNSIASLVREILSCACIGLGCGGGIMVGNELGAGKIELAKKYGNCLCGLSVFVGVLTGILAICVIPFVPYFTNLTPRASSYISGMLFIIGLNLVGKAINTTTIGGIFCAGGDTKFGLYCDTITLWAIIIPLGLLAAFVFKLPVLVVYLIVSLDEIIKLPVVFARFFKYKWLKNITRGSEEIAKQ